jgi:hypothetical protein
VELVEGFWPAAFAEESLTPLMVILKDGLFGLEDEAIDCEHQVPPR